MLKNANNPQEILRSLASRNPQVQQVMSLVEQSGGNAKEAFYKTAAQRGVNPEEILNLLK